MIVVLLLLLLLLVVLVLVLVLVVLIYLYGRWICLFSGEAHKHSIVAVQPEELTTNDGRSVRLLKLPEGEDWYGLGFRILFERDFYGQFYDDFFGHYKKATKVIVSGTPGIGKSAFGLYCVYRGLKDGKTVVYQTAHEPVYIIFSSTTFSRTERFPHEMLHRSENIVIFVCDGVRPANVPCPTILVTSPKKEVWFQFFKLPGCILRYFGRWDRDNELEMLRKNCFPHVTAEAMQRTVDLWGEVPRFALTKAADDSVVSEEALNKLIKTHDPVALLQSKLLTESGKDDTTHRLIHVIPGEKFKDGGRDFASEKVVDKVYEELRISANDRLQQFIFDFGTGQLSISDLGVLVGKLFERHALKCLLDGGTFQTRNLTDGTMSEVEFDKVDKYTMLGSMDQVDQERSAVYVPGKNFAAIDCIVTKPPISVWMVNATSNPKHNVLMDSSDGKSGLYRLDTFLPEQLTEKNFCFAVPEFLFNKFQSLPKGEWKTKVDDEKKSIVRLSQLDRPKFMKKFNWYALSVSVPNPRIIASQPAKKMLHTLRVVAKHIR